MLRQLSTVVLVFVAAVGSLALATAAEPKTDGKTKSPPKELTMDIGKGIKLEMVLIPAGEFMMGAPDSEKGAFENEKPRHRVRITKRFYLGKYLVTQEQWECLMGNNPSAFQGPKKPVEQIVWKDCRHFLEKLNAKFGAHRGKFVLPSEAQWEYSCRAGGSTRFYFGDDEKKLGDYAWYDANSDNSTHPVGEKRPNAWGLYDMAGNVQDGIWRNSMNWRYVKTLTRVRWMVLTQIPTVCVYCVSAWMVCDASEPGKTDLLFAAEAAASGVKDSAERDLLLSHIAVQCAVKRHDDQALRVWMTISGQEREPTLNQIAAAQARRGNLSLSRKTVQIGFQHIAKTDPHYVLPATARFVADALCDAGHEREAAAELRGAAIPLTAACLAATGNGIDAANSLLREIPTHPKASWIVLGSISSTQSGMRS